MLQVYFVFLKVGQNYYTSLLSQEVRLPKLRFWKTKTRQHFHYLQFAIQHFFELHDTLYTPSSITPLHHNPPLVGSHQN